MIGMISCWTVDGKNKPASTFTNNVQHTSTITVLKWNPTGKRLVTGDKVRNNNYFLCATTVCPIPFSFCGYKKLIIFIFSFNFFFCLSVLSVLSVRVVVSHTDHITERSGVRLAGGRPRRAQSDPPVPQEGKYLGPHLLRPTT
jgi:WD40 repeat protein